MTEVLESNNSYESMVLAYIRATEAQCKTFAMSWERKRTSQADRARHEDLLRTMFGTLFEQRPSRVLDIIQMSNESFMTVVSIIEGGQFALDRYILKLRHTWDQAPPPADTP